MESGFYFIGKVRVNIFHSEMKARKMIRWAPQMSVAPAGQSWHLL